MLQDHRRDLVLPIRSAGAHEMLAGETCGWFEVVERVVGPDSEVVKRGGDGDFLDALSVAAPQR